MGGGGGGGGTLIFSYVCDTGYFLGFKILNFNIFWGLEKTEYYWGYEDFVDIFGGYEDFVDTFGVITKLDYIYRSFICILGSFLKAKVQNGGFFLGLLKFQIFIRGA